MLHNFCGGKIWSRLKATVRRASIEYLRKSRILIIKLCLGRFSSVQASIRIEGEVGFQTTAEEEMDAILTPCV